MTHSTAFSMLRIKLPFERDPVESISISPRAISNPVGEYRSETDPTVLVKRFVLNPKESFPQDGLSEGEKQLFQSAFEELKRKDSAQQFIDEQARHDSPNNIVLVDVFLRNSQAAIPEVRTICLWKTSTNNFTLIDPVNSKDTECFQNFLQRAFPERAFPERAFPDSKMVIAIYASSNDGSFYILNPNSCSPGVGENDSRDATDIAVKIAFKLNEEQRVAVTSNIAKILKSIKTLSNQGQVNKALGKVVCIAMRELQSSNAETRQYFLDLLKKHQIYVETGNIKTASSLLELDQSRKSRMPLTDDGKGEIVHFYEIFQDFINNRNLSKLQVFDAHGKTLLHWAVENCNETEVASLVEEIQKTDTLNVCLNAMRYNGCTALHLSMRIGNPKIALLLIEKFPQLIGQTDAQNRTPLHWLASGKDAQNRTPLHWLASGKDVENRNVKKRLWRKVRALLANNKESVIKKTKTDEFTALHLAIQASNVNWTRLLVIHCAELVPIPDFYGQTALHWIAYQDPFQQSTNEWRYVTCLIVKKLNGDLTQKTTKEEYTALHLAIQTGNLELAVFLVERCLNLVDMCDVYGQTALHWAVSKKQKDKNLVEFEGFLAQMMLKKSGIAQKTKSEEYKFAGFLVQKMLKKSGIAQKTKSEEYTVLHFSIHSGNLEIFRLLVDSYLKFLPDSEPASLLILPDKYGQTPLHWIASKDNVEERDYLEITNFLVDVMLKNEFDLAQQTLQGYTALHLAIHSGNTEIAEQLLNKSPKLAAIQDIHGQTALHWVASKDHKEESRYLKLTGILAKTMLENGIGLKQQTKNEQYTALHYAVHSGNTEIFSKLIELDPTLACVSDAYGQTVLHWIASKNHIEEDLWVDIVENHLLKSMGNEVNKKTNTNQTAETFAKSAGNMKIFNLIQNYNISLSHAVAEV